MRTLSAFTLALGIAAVTSLASAQDFDAAGEQTMLDRIDAVRAEAGLPPLTRMPALDAVARQHSVEMAASGALSHVSEVTGTPEDRVRAAGVEASVITENVALHQDSAHAMEALLASPPHRANVLDARVNRIGLGAVRSNGAVYVTQVFAEVAQPAPSVAAAEPEASDEGAMVQIIPPFLEETHAAPASLTTTQPSEPAGDAAVSESATAPSPAASAAPAASPSIATTAPAIAPASPQGVAADDAPSQSPAPSPTAPAQGPALAAAAPAAPAAPETAQDDSLSAATASRLRQLVGLAESLLGASANDEQAH